MFKRLSLLVALALGLYAPAWAQTETALNNFGSSPVFLLTSPSNGQCLVYLASTGQWVNGACSGGGGSGTVTSVSVVSANGLSGSVATATTTPAITLSTSISGPLKGASGALAAAAASDISGLYGGSTGTGTLVLATSPTLVTPALGTPSAAVLTNATGLPLSSGVTGTLPNANLANSAITFGATSQALGSTVTNLNAVNVGPTTPGTGAFTTLSATTPLPVTSGGNGLGSAVLGDLRYGSGTNTLAALAGNTTATKNFLTQTGTGSVSAAPAWGTIASGDLPAGVPTAAANPSASIGLAAVNGSAATFMRSDAAPALSLAINPVGANSWTATHEWSLTEPRLLLNQSGAGTDLKLWDIDLASGVFSLRTRTDADAAGVTWLSATRGTTTATASIAFGNTGNPSMTWNSTAMTLSAGGSLVVASSVTGGRLVVTANTVAQNGIYLPSANTLGFATSSASIGSWNSSGFEALTNIVAATAGTGFRTAEGSNAKQGTCTMVAGTCTVSNTSVTANSRIFLTEQSLGTVAVPSALAISARTAGTSFTVLASALTDTSVVAWEIFEPAP